MRKRTPFAFHSAYCAGHINSLGFWEADGRSERAETELVPRLGILMIKRDRSEVWKDTPPKQRQVIRIDGPVREDTKDIIQAVKKSERHLYKRLEETLEYKVDHVCERVVEEMINGEKAIVWVLSRQSVEIMTTALEKELGSRDLATRMREVRCRLWATHGEADIKARRDLAADFRSHKGAGIIVATIDALPDSINLYGASTEHYAQMHYLPGPMEQSENRPYLEGTSRLHIFYYVVKGTVDEHVEQILIPRLQMADKLSASKDAAATHSALTADQKVESFEEFIARLTRNVPDDSEITLADDFHHEHDEEDE